MNDGFSFLHVSNHLPSYHFVASSNLWFKGPDLFEVECVSVNTTGDEDTHFLLKGRERALDTVVNLGQQTRSE